MLCFNERIYSGKQMTKYNKYQDYVIKDGKLIGEFEAMYKDYEDPWEQTTREL